MLKLAREDGLRVAWCVWGGLGDALQAVPFIERFKERFGPARLVFYKDDARLDSVGRIVAASITGQEGAFREGDLDSDIAADMYDLRIDVRRVPRYTVLNPQRVKSLDPALWAQIETAHKRVEPLRFVFDHHPLYDGAYGRLMADYGMNVVDSSLYYGGFDDSRHDRPTIRIAPQVRDATQRFGLTPGSYVTVHDGFDVFNALAGTGTRPTRAWPRGYWEKLVTDLKAARPDLQIVQLGVSETSDYLQGVDHYLIGATSIEEAICLIDGAALHLDTEGGFIPCAWSLGTPAISIQGPTGSSFYHYDGVTQLFDSRCHGCWWSTADWMERCPRGLERAICMDRVTPEAVLAAALERLSNPAAAIDTAACEPVTWGTTIWGADNKDLPPLDIAAGQLDAVHWRGRRATQERTAAAAEMVPPPVTAGTPAPVAPLLDHAEFTALMARDGEDFVANAYLAILQREADESGLQHYTTELADGKLTKVALLKIVLTSDEAKRTQSAASKDAIDQAFVAAAYRLLRQKKGRNLIATDFSGLLRNDRYGYDLFVKALSLRDSAGARGAFTHVLRKAAAVDEAGGETGLRVAVYFTGGLGDMLQQVPFADAFNKRFQPGVLDLYFHGAKQSPGTLAVQCVPGARGPFKIDDLDEDQYDLRIDMKHAVKYLSLNPDRIKTLSPVLFDLVEKATARFVPYQFIHDHHANFDGLFGRLMAKYGMNAVQATGFLGGLAMSNTARPDLKVDPGARDVLERLALDRGKYIVVHDGFDVDHHWANASNRSTKNWPIPHWERLIQLIKTERPDLKIVQIGHSKTSQPMHGVDCDLLSKTSFGEVIAILQEAALHITPEGGFLRVAWALDIPTISLQGPSGSKFFQFGDTTQIVSDACNGCWFVLEEWMARCYRGYKSPICMNGIRPETVMSEVRSLLDTKNFA
jgi:ADP-heptose:LPS heptosyltransferase